MTVRVYTCVSGESREVDIQKFDHLFQEIGINMVVTHGKIALITTLELPITEIDRLEKENPEGTNQPLQMNSLYSFVSLDLPDKFPNKPPISKLLSNKKVKESYRSGVILSLPQERDLRQFPFPVWKDISFYDETTDQDIGWYNASANIIWVSDLFHSPTMGEAVIISILKTIRDFKQFKKLDYALTIGADPEWELTLDGELVEASALFPDRDMKSRIGHDGHSATGEFRPKESRSPLGLARNIKRLVRTLNGSNTMKGYEVWAGGGIYVTTGGHLHFGMKGMSPALKETLYDLVAEPVLQYQSEFRKRSESGNFSRNGGSVTREQPHGIEWRPLPSFIVDENITCAILCTSYAIVKSHKFYNYRKAKVKVKAKEEDYKLLPLYPIYKKYIDDFIELFLKPETKVQLYKRNILTAWKIPTIKPNFSVDITCDESWLNTYFKSLNVKLKKPVNLSLRLHGGGISTYRIPEEYLSELKEFSERHFLPPLSIFEDGPKNPNQQVICLPATWWSAQKPERAFNEFKPILKNLILNLGRG